MKKWFFGILTGAATLILIILIADAISGKPLASYWNAVIAYFAGYAVYKTLKKRENRSVKGLEDSRDLRQEVGAEITNADNSEGIREEEKDYEPYRE